MTQHVELPRALKLQSLVTSDYAAKHFFAGAKLKNNAQTWARLTRLDLQHLSISLGNAALKELPRWPANGQGRLVKAETEKITRTLERVFDQKDLNFTFDVLQDVTDSFSGISAVPFYKKFLAEKIYEDRKGNILSYDLAISRLHENVARFVHANRPPRPTIKVIRQEKVSPPPAAVENDVEQPLSEVVPAQQSAPLQFTVTNGKLRLKKQSAKSKAEDRKSITLAKASLQDDSNALLLSLRETNADPRLSVAVSGIRDTLSSDADVIRLGMVSVSCETLYRKFADQLSDIVSAQLEAFSTNLSLFVAQFPEWQRFIENANQSTNLTPDDIECLYKGSITLVHQLKADETLVDPQVPKSIELILEAIRDPKRSSKRAVYGTVTMLQNLFSAIFTGFGGMLGSGFSGLKEGVKTSAKAVTIAALLMAAAQYASTLSPAISKLTNSNWLEHAAKIVQKALEK